MNKEEKEAIEHLKWLLDDGILSSEDEPQIQIILNLIRKQEKIINDIKFITYNNKPHITQEKIIEYFKKEVEKE